jgi:hypothetical protein
MYPWRDEFPTNCPGDGYRNFTEQFVKWPTGPTKKDRPKTVICTARPRDLATEVRDHALSLCIPTTMIGDDGAGAAPPMLRLST